MPSPPLSAKLDLVLPVKSWTMSFKTRSSLYKQLTEEYSTQLGQILNRETRTRLQLLKSRSIDLQLDSSHGILHGICLSREPPLDGTRRFEGVSLRAGTEFLARGQVVLVSATQIRIKFERPLDLVEQIKKLKSDTATSGSGNGNADSNVVEQKIVCSLEFDTQLELERSERICEALKRLSRVSCSPQIHSCLLGLYNNLVDIKYDAARVLSPPQNNIVALNSAQRVALLQSMKRRVSLIEGPPASGKTLLAAHLACNMSRIKRAKVLLCSPLELTLNKLVEMIENVEGVSLVKLPSVGSLKAQNRYYGDERRRRLHPHRPRRPWQLVDEESSNKSCDLNKLVDEQLYWSSWNRTRKALGKGYCLLHEQAARMVAGSSQHARRKLEQRIVHDADIVCCSLTQAGSYLLEGVNFDMVIIDDVSWATELECLLAITARGVKQVSLIGEMRESIRLNGQSASTWATTLSDANNLPLGQNSLPLAVKKPEVKALRRQRRLTATSSSSSSARSLRRRASGRPNKRQTASAGGGEQSSRLEPSEKLGGLFERLLAVGMSAADLRLQYRTHEQLADIIGRFFYMGRFKADSNSNSALSSKLAKCFENDGFAWLPERKCPSAMFVCSAESSSALNRLEETLRHLVVDLLIGQEGVRESKLGIITNLESDKLRNFSAINQIETGAIGQFVGKEKDFIILVAAEETEQSSNVETSCNVCDTSLTVASNFVFDVSALNVALTRARLGLFIVTDFAIPAGGACQQEEPRGRCSQRWLELMSFYANNNLLIR